MFCGNCGKQIPDHAVFCPLCGMRADGTDSVPEPAPAERVAAPIAAEPAKPQKAPKPARKKKKTSRKTAIIIAAVAVVVVAAVVVGGVLVLGDFKEKYADATELLEDGEYQEAKAAFEDIAIYKDSGTRAKEAGYHLAEELLEEEKYLEAQAAFTALGGYEDSREQADTAGKLDICMSAEDMIRNTRYEDALALLTPLAGFAKADTLIEEGNNAIAYRDADALMQAGDYLQAKTAFEALAPTRTHRGWRRSAGSRSITRRRCC